MVFSSIINIVSNQESDTRYVAKENKMDIESIMHTFGKKMKQTIKICEQTQRDIDVLKASKAYLLDSRHATMKIKKDSVDFIMTSPPYPNTYDYYLYHKHRMLWLDNDFKNSMNLEIGSRHEFSSKKHPPSNFTRDLHEIMSECNKVLRQEAKAVIVIGDGVVQGELYDSRLNTISICESVGWRLIDSTLNDLDDISRSFNKNFRYKGKKEHILVFEKV